MMKGIFAAIGGNARDADLRPLVYGGQERRAPVVDAAMAEVRGDRDEAGQILVFRPEAVSDPGPHTRPDEGIAACVKFQKGTAVPRIRTVHRVDDAQVVDLTGQVGKQLADGGPTLPVALKPERRAKEVAGRARDHARLRER